MQTMTKAQQQALEAAYLILGEHFDHAVVLTSWDVDGAPQAVMGHKLLFKGGSMAALGLMAWGTDRILDQDRQNSDKE